MNAIQQMNTIHNFNLSRQKSRTIGGIYDLVTIELQEIENNDLTKDENRLSGKHRNMIMGGKEMIRIHWSPIAFLLVLFVILSADTGFADTIKVNSPKSLNEAIENAKKGDTILLSAGTYQSLKNLRDFLLINKHDLTIKGEGRAVIQWVLPPNR